MLLALAARDKGACEFSPGNPASRESNDVPCLVGSPKVSLDLGAMPRALNTVLVESRCHVDTEPWLIVADKVYQSTDGYER